MDSKNIIIVILTIIVAIDQALAAIPSVKSNAMYQLVSNVLTSVMNSEKDSQ